jgi:predicted DNA-binding WGR domain protein
MTEVDPTSQSLQILVLERRDKSRNMARFYVLSIEPTLFGDAGLVREWDRIGCNGRRRLEFHGDDGQALEAHRKLALAQASPRL